MAFSPVIFPSTNDVRGASPAGTGNVLAEAQLAGKWAKAIGCAHNYTISGAAVTGVGAADATLATGVHMIDGYYVDQGGTNTVTPTVNTTGYIYAKLSRDGSNNVTSTLQLLSTTSYATATGADCVILARYVKGATNISALTDMRRSKSWNPTLTMRRTTSLTVPTATPTHVFCSNSSGASFEDNDDMTGGDTGGGTVRTAGVYRITASCPISGASGGIVYIYVNGTAIAGGALSASGAPGVITLTRRLAAGDTVNMYVRQDSGSSQVVNGATEALYARLSMNKVSD